jgi:transcriptional regulator with XRE-family HTH domain
MTTTFPRLYLSMNKKGRTSPIKKHFKDLFDKTERSIVEKMLLLRKERGLLQKDWAELYSIGLSYVKGYEVSRYTPSLALLLVASDDNKVSLDWITGRSDVRFKKMRYAYNERRDYDGIFAELIDVAYPRLRSLREERGFTQTTWAGELGLDETYFRTFEAQKWRHPSLSVVTHIADYCGVSLDWIYGRTNVEAL